MIIRNNGNGQVGPAGNPEGMLRSQIFAMVDESKIGPERAQKVLCQCTAHLRNRQLIEEFAGANKMKLSGFRTNEALEVYFDVMTGREELGYISKGWEDPGFRVGDLIVIPKNKAAQFKAASKQIRKLCATNGIGMTVEKTKDSIEIHVDGVIYNEGFNKKTFKKTIETLHECVEKVREIIG